MVYLVATRVQQGFHTPLLGISGCSPEILTAGGVVIRPQSAGVIRLVSSSTNRNHQEDNPDDCG